MQGGFNSPPFYLVGRIDCLRSNSDPSGRRNLVSHQRQERRDQKCTARSLIAKKSRGEKVHQALAPSRPLDHKEPRLALNQSGDRLPLSVAEGRSIVSECLPKKLERLCLHMMSPAMAQATLVGKLIVVPSGYPALRGRRGRCGFRWHTARRPEGCAWTEAPRHPKTLNAANKTGRPATTAPWPRRLCWNRNTKRPEKLQLRLHLSTPKRYDQHTAAPPDRRSTARLRCDTGGPSREITDGYE